jgi:hypothetical protein
MQGIYKLFFANNPNKVYVGKSVDVVHRYSKHVYALISQTHHNRKLLAEYARENILPEYCTLEIVTDPEALNSREIFWINKLNSFVDGFNLTTGGEGGSVGENHIAALYTNEKYIEILKTLLANTDLDTTQISKLLKVSSAVVYNILNQTSHLWLKNKEPELYAKMLAKPRKCGGRLSMPIEKYVTALYVLAYTNKPLKTISEELEISISILSDISKGQSHTYLKEAHPEAYNILLSKKGTGCRARNTWPQVRSPDGIIYDVENSAAFARSMGLDSGGFSRLLNGKQKTQKGWKLFIP